MVPPKIPCGEFSPVRLQGRSIRRGLPALRQFASALRAFAPLRYVRSGSESGYAVRSCTTVRTLRSTPGALSGRTMARIGLRMMPPFPSSPLSFRTADFLQSGWKAGNFRRGLPVDCEFNSRRTVCLRPSCASLPSSMPRSESRDAVRRCTTVHTVSRITPGVLATVQVVLSWSINAY